MGKIKPVKVKPLKERPVVGIIEGGGTGKELAEVFRRVVSTLYEERANKKPEFLSFEELFGYRPKTFWELKDKYYSEPYDTVREICKRDVDNILRFYDIVVERGGVGIFRTAINAETLYDVRREVRAIKVVPLKIKRWGRSINLVLVRDQTQGYYTHEKIEIREGKIIITVLFEDERFNKITRFVKRLIDERLIDELSDVNALNSMVLFIYKFHLPGLELQKSIDRAVKYAELNFPYKIVQPDTGMHLLSYDIFLDKGLEHIENLIAVVGNEVGDIAHESFIHLHGLGTKETTFTSNYLLEKGGIEELQTMHGSADDIAGKGIVNPTATLKAAAYALERWLNIDGAIRRMNELIEKAIQTRNITPDMGGNRKTMEVVDYILENW